MTTHEPITGDILVVDDDQTALTFLERILINQGHTVRTAPLAREAMRSFQSAFPDLVLLDVALPDQNGFELCQEMKRIPGGTAVPVIFISGLTNTADKVKSFAVGGVDFVSKPFTVELVLARVATHLALSRALREMEARNARLELEIAQRRQAEAQLRLSETRFRGAFETSAHGMALISPDGHLLQVNPALCAILGYNEAELLTNTILNLTHPDDRHSDREFIRRMLAGTIHSCQLEKRYLHKKGHTISTLLSLSLVRNQDGQPVHFVSQVQDISARKEVEKQLREAHTTLEERVLDQTVALRKAIALLHQEVEERSHIQQQLQQERDKLQDEESRLREITATLAEGLYVIDRKGRITFINPAALAMLHWNLNEVLGRDSHGLFHHSLPDGSPYPVTECHTRHVATQGIGPLDEETFFWRKDGSGFPVTLTASPLFRNGHPGGAVVAFHDISEHKRLEESLRHAKESAEAANRAKGEFLAAMSHEIRTPMNVVMGMAEILLETDLTPQQRRFAQTMHHSGKALLSVINDVLDFSRIESGRFQLVEAPFSPRQVVEETVRLMGVAAEEKGLTMEQWIAPALPETILGDDSRVRQVLINLLGNGIKFTAQGRVDVRLTQDPDSPNCLLFSVSDTGIGIDREQTEQIFEHFIQADAGITRRYGGTGLGLAISRHLVEMMGGRIWVESRLNEGSTFHFTLPAKSTTLPAPATRSEPPGPVSQKQGLRILLAEDVEENRMLFEAYLMKSPHRLVMVNDGVEAVAKVKEETFDVVVMDVQMPRMDGYTAIRHIRAWERERQSTPVPIITLSAHAMTGEMERCREAGGTFYLSKPIGKKGLLAALQQITIPPPEAV
ncbi:MAG: PAS domain S-box protein [Magnetococcales bacterium]|nr:PAS domain S-box protein [Magnetococcales bacterium]